MRGSHWVLPITEGWVAQHRANHRRPALPSQADLTTSANMRLSLAALGAVNDAGCPRS